MSENTAIEWADHTFNPWVGCTKVSPACDHCYAEGWAKRSGMVEWGGERRRTSEANWKMPLKWDAQAKDEGRRVRVFCASLADVFDNQVPFAWRVELFQLIAKTSNIDWLLLTKRIGNARQMLNEVIEELSHGINTWDDLPWPGVWIGATVADQAEADRDIPKLLAVPARVRFLSVEPMLGPISLSPCWLNLRCGFGNDEDRAISHCFSCGGLSGYSERCAWPSQRIDWVICGGESGPGARPMHPDWARRLRDKCAAAGVPFLFKQWGEWIGADQAGCPCGPPASRWQWGDGTPFVYGDKGALPLLCRAGKKAAGRLLDGVEHNGYPACS